MAFWPAPADRGEAAACLAVVLFVVGNAMAVVSYLEMQTVISIAADRLQITEGAMFSFTLLRAGVGLGKHHAAAHQ